MSAFATGLGALGNIAGGLGTGGGGPQLSSSGPAVSGNNTVIVPDVGLNAGAIINALQGPSETGGINFGLPNGLSTRKSLGSVGVAAKVPGGSASFSINPLLLIGGAVVTAFFLLR